MKNFLKKTSVIYSASSVLKSGIQMLVGLAIAKFITPGDYGIWSSLNLLLTYAIVLQFGVLNGLNLELPLAMGRGDSAEAHNLVRTSQAYILICIGLTFFLGLFYLLFFAPAQEKYFYGAIVIILMIAMTFYQDFLTATFRTQNSFIKFSIINIVHAIVNLLTVLLIIYYAYYGLILKTLLVFFVYTVFLHVYRPFKLKVHFDKTVYLKLIKVGLPIFILSYVQAIALSFDRLLLIKYTDIDSVGIYSFAYLAFSSITLFSASIASYIYPSMSAVYARNNNPTELWEYLKRNMLMVFLGLLAFAVLGASIVPYLIKVFFPHYVASIPVMQILFFAGVFNGSVIGVNVLLSMKKWRLVFSYHTIFSVLLVLCPLVLIQFSENKITAVAWGVLLANVINLPSGYILVYYGTKKS